MVSPKLYKRMLNGMDRRRGKREWSVYILRCSDGTLYTGIAKDVDARLKAHNGGKGARYTRLRGPVTLLYKENGMNRSKALSRELAIKALSKRQKENLVAS